MGSERPPPRPTEPEPVTLAIPATGDAKALSSSRSTGLSIIGATGSSVE